jgi:enoyl-CoA hydratase/carnithine racemase
VADLEFSRDGAVATVLLNRPERRNAFTLEMVDEWVEALAEADAAPGVRAIVVRGAGGSFCAGIDLELVAPKLEGSAFEVKEMLRRIQRLPRAVARLQKPYIAAVSGPAVGAGLDLCLGCDMRLAGESARMGETYVRAGLVPGAGGAWYLPRLVGLPLAFELIATGKLIDAATALRIGLVNSVHPDDLLVEETYALAERLAETPVELLSLLKRLVNQSATADLDTALDLASSHLGVVRAMPEARAAYERILESLGDRAAKEGS